MTELQLLTHSRQDAFKTCRRKHWFLYQKAIRPVEDAKALRMGSGYHAALETFQKTNNFDAAVERIRLAYDAMPDHYEPHDWGIERETVTQLFCGYVWRWSGQTMEVVATEQTFELPLINPETGQPSRTFAIAGKIDGIIRLEDGRLNVIEHKLLGEDLGSDSNLWKRLRIDHQISLYVYAARQLGYQVEGVIFNSSRKPTIGSSPVPVVDGDGVKVVIDVHGERVKNKNGSWRQTGDTAAGYTILTRPMTTAEWGAKLIADIQERPDFYFCRQEIPRLDKHIDECLAELWDVAKTIRDAQINDRHYRTVGRNCSFCAFFNICTEDRDLTNLPEGFEVVTDLHPELERPISNTGVPTDGRTSTDYATETAPTHGAAASST